MFYLRFFFCSLLFMCMAGCHPAGTDTNSAIDSSSKTQIAGLNARLVEAIGKGDTKALSAMMSDRCLQNMGDILDALVGRLKPGLKSNRFVVLDEFKTSNQKPGTVVVLTKNTGAETDYKLKYTTSTADSYVSLILPEAPVTQLMLTCIYGKYGNDWKLETFRVGEYAILGKTAPEYYKMAKTDYEKGKLFDAVNDLGLAKETAMPAEYYFLYLKMDEMKTFAKKLALEARQKYPMPMAVALPKTHPQIFNVSAQALNEGIFPLVSYKTQIDLKDTVALKAENEELKEVIGTVLPGIEKEKKYVFFKASNEIPTGKKLVTTYGFQLVTGEK